MVPSDSVMKLWVHVALAGGHDVSAAAAGAAASKPRTAHTAVHRTANHNPCTTPRVARTDSLTINPALPFPLDWTGVKIRRPLGECVEPSDSGWLVENAQCMLGKGLEFEGRLDQAMFHVLTLCRGQQPLSAVLAQAAARTGQSLDQISTGCLATVRSLIDQGFLWPVDEEPVAR